MQNHYASPLELTINQGIAAILEASQTPETSDYQRPDRNPTCSVLLTLLLGWSPPTYFGRLFVKNKKEQGERGGWGGGGGDCSLARSNPRGSTGRLPRQIHLLI